MITRKLIVIPALAATIAGSAGFWLAGEIRARDARTLFISGHREPFTATYQSDTDKEVTLEFRNDHQALLRRGILILQQGHYSVRRDNIIHGVWLQNDGQFYYRIDGPDLHTGATGVRDDYTLIR